MLYPKSQIESKLNFDIIRNWLQDFCLSDLAIELVDEIQFLTNPSEIERLQNQTKTFKEILDEDRLYPNIFFEDIRPFLRKANIPNSFLEPDEFQLIRAVLKINDHWLEFFEEDDLDKFKYLKFEFKNAISFKELITSIDAIIDSKGEILNNASPELREIRKNISSLESKVRKSMQRVYKEANDKGYLSEQSEITIRNGRLVIPFASENKRAIKGYIHDHSSTGQTAFVEPADVFEMNNELQDLFANERKEIIRILINLTNDLRPNIRSIELSMRFLAKMDLIRAKAKLAQKTQAQFPSINSSGILNIKNAKHPVLLDHQEKLNKSIVPLSLKLDGENRILIISGPNAGGKSVALKTVGVSIYMFQCGLPVSMDSTSSLYIFEDIFLDIGDEQSIENDLSTYSSHLTNMREMLNHCGNKSLVLIDEFGTGTDPQLGGAIAEAILLDLNSKNSKGMVNTHYSNLKALADNEIGLVNGAMQFDIENLIPLYELKVGKPGSSFAFEVAEKIGLSNHILEKAKKIVGYSQIDYDKLLGTLEAEKRELEELNFKLTQKDANLARIADEYKTLKETLKTERTKILEEAKREAAGIVKGANRRIEKTIREIKEKQADKVKTKQLREELDSYLDHTVQKSKKSVKSDGIKKNAIIEEIDNSKLKVGDSVEVISSNAKGEILSIRNNEAEIAIGNIKSFIKLKNLQRVGKIRNVNSSSSNYSNLSGFNTLDFKSKIDLRGKRTEEAIKELEKYLDKALMAGVSEIHILHGKGDGILRKMLREYLKPLPQIKSFESEHVERGGEGITKVFLN